MTRAAPATPRRSARVILLSPDNEVLLIHFVIARADGAFAFWATPGGEVEEAESDRAAAERELREELGLELALEGPVHTAVVTFEHKGAMVVSTDVFFIARCEDAAPRLRGVTEEERAVMRVVRWWSLSDIEVTVENVFPAELSAIVRRLVS